MAQPKIFVSHSSDDTTFATKLVDDLNAAGAHAWLDTKELGAGNFQERISDALDECEWFVLVLTRNALASTWVRQETDAANHLQHAREIKNLIFVKAGPVTDRELPALWRVYNRYDAITEKQYQDALNRVLKDVGLQPAAAKGTSVYPEIAIEAARQHFLVGKDPYDIMGNWVLWSDRIEADVSQRGDRLRKRLLSREPAFQVGDLVARANGHGSGVVCAVDTATAYVSWYGITDIVHGYWTNPETIPLDQLELKDASPYPLPASGDVTTLQQSDISMARSLAFSIQAESLDTGGAEIRWVPADRLKKAWQAGDIVRRYSRPAQPGGKGVTFGQTGVICGGDKGVPEISWCYRDEHGAHWQNPEVVPLTQLLWFKLVEKETGAKTVTNA
jgi:TIR domain